MPKRRRKKGYLAWVKHKSKAIAAFASCLLVVSLLTALELRGVTSEALGVIAVAAATALGTYFSPPNRG